MDQNTTTLSFLACAFFTGTWTSSWSALIRLDSRPRVIELAAKKKLELIYMLLFPIKEDDTKFSVDVVTLGLSDSLEFWCSGQSFWKCSTEPQTRQQPPTRTKLHISVKIHRYLVLKEWNHWPAAYSPFGLSRQALDRCPVWPQIKHLAYG